MTLIIRFLSILALGACCLALGACCFSVTLAADPAPAAPSAVVTPAPTLSYKDQFLGLVLEKAQKYSGKVEDALGTAVDAAEKEAPALARQFLVWKAIDAALTIVIPLLTAIPFVLFIWYGFPKWMAIYQDPNRMDERNRHNWSTVTCSKAARYIPFSIIGMIGTAVCFVDVIGNLDALRTIAEIYFAPHVYLMERALALVQHH